MIIDLDSPLTLSEIKTSTGSLTPLTYNAVIRKITTDSREASPSSLFIALNGKKLSGTDFLRSAKDRGAVTLGASEFADIPVKNSEEALLALAHHYKKKHLTKIKATVAVTGSVGKTTTREFINKLLCDKHKTHSSYENYNNAIGVPLTVLSAPEDTEILICEVGMNSSGEIDRLSKCIEPDVAVITNIGTAHIGNLGSREKIAEAKLEILSGMSDEATLCVPYGEELLKNKGAKTFSAFTKKADISVIGNDTVEIFSDGIKIGDSGFALSEYHHRECLAAALCASLTVGDESEVIAAIPKISNRDVRAKIYKAQGFYILDDCYNASYESINAAMNQLSALSGYSERCVLLGDVLELGEFSEEIHIKIGRLITRFAPSRIYLYGKFAKHTRLGALSMGFSNSDIYDFDIGKEAALVEKIKELNRDGGIMLVKPHAVRALCTLA